MKYQYTYCDDQMILATDGTRHYYVITELWDEWLDFPEGAGRERGSGEKYLLPIALKRWDSLCWEAVDRPDWPVSYCLLCEADSEEDEEHRPGCNEQKDALYRMARERV